MTTEVEKNKSGEIVAQQLLTMNMLPAKLLLSILPAMFLTTHKYATVILFFFLIQVYQECVL